MIINIVIISISGKVLSKHEEKSDPKSSSQKKQEHGDILNIDNEDDDNHKSNGKLVC